MKAQMTTLLTILATASTALTSATSIATPSTFRTEIFSSTIPSATASLAIADNTTGPANWTLYERPVLRAKGPKPGDLCDDISPMCYAITHGKRDCWRAWQVRVLPLLFLCCFVLVFCGVGGLGEGVEGVVKGREKADACG